jgi:hypothetical protein
MMGACILMCRVMLQKYLDMAEEDKARYKEELSVYQASEDYMAYLAKRKTRSGGE